MALEIVASIYTVFVGGFRFQAGGLRISAASWSGPLAQAGWLGAIAAWQFHRDATLRGEWDYVPRTLLAQLSGSADDVRRRLLWFVLIVGSVASLLVSYRIARQSLVVGSYEGGWIHPFMAPIALTPFVVWAIASVAVIVALRWLPDGRHHSWKTIVIWMLLGLGIQGLLRSLTPYTLEQMFASAGANSFYTATLQQDAATVLSDFARVRDTWPIHAHSNLPGKLMVVYALEIVSAQPAVLAWLVVGLSSLGAWLTYVFVRDLFNDRRVALFSLILYLFVPGKLFFFPLMNTLTPTVAMAMAVIVQRWLVTGRVLYATAAGVAVFGVTFFEPIPLVIGVLLAALVARAWRRGNIAGRALVAHVAVGAFAFIATYAAVRIWFGFDLIDAFERVSAGAVGFNQAAGRRYDVWVRQNLTDFFFGMGVCQTLLFGAALGLGLGETGRGPIWVRPIVVLGLSLSAMLFAIDVAGINRGEVIRLWIFLQCLFQIPAAYVCARLNSRVALAVVVVTTLLQSALGTATIGFVIP